MQVPICEQQNPEARSETHLLYTTEEDEHLPPYCAKCGGGPLGDAHLCDVCLKPNHPWCGIKIGEDGYGQPVRCETCVPPPTGVTAGKHEAASLWVVAVLLLSRQSLQTLCTQRHIILLDVLTRWRTWH